MAKLQLLEVQYYKNVDESKAARIDLEVFTARAEAARLDTIMEKAKLETINKQIELNLLNSQNATTNTTDKRPVQWKLGAGQMNFSGKASDSSTIRQWC